jgi:hypothetical protein
MGIAGRLAALLFLGAVASPAVAADRCPTGRAVVSVGSLADLPDDMRRDVQTGGRVADLGKPYFDFDHVMNGSLPVRRLAQAGYSADRWYAWIETGLPGLGNEILGFARDGKNGWRRIAELSGDPCKAIDAVLAGVGTPSLAQGDVQIYKDPGSGSLFVVGRDGRHLTAIGPDGKVRWDVDPFEQAGLDPYRSNRPMIVRIGSAPAGLKDIRQSDFIAIAYDSSQFGIVRIADGSFEFLGQD